MAKFLIGTTPFAGHITPVAPIAQRLVERGHDVRWYTGEKYRPRVEQTGAQFLPMHSAPDFDDQNLGARFPEWERLDGLKALKFMIKHICTDSAAGQIEDLRTIHADFPADVVLADTTFLGARWFHELGGPPWAVYNQLPVTLSSRDTAPFGLGLPPAASALGRFRVRVLQALLNGIVFRDTSRYTDRARERLGLPPTGTYIMDNQLSPYLYLQGTVQGFEYPRSDLPPQVHFIGPMLPPAPDDFEPPDWWEDLKSGRPVVHVTQGTLATDAEQLLVPTIQALASEDVLVVATTGGKPAESLGLDRLPDNARVEPFIPHAHLLPHVDLMITNGGYNGVQTALAHGVPLIAGGTTEDKPEVCARIAWTGVGINLKTATPSQRRLREAVATVLADDSYQRKAQALAAEFALHDAPGEASVLLEHLAKTGQPVVRRPCELIAEPTAGSATA